MKRSHWALAAAAALAGCASGATDPAPEMAGDRPMTCNAAGAQSHIGTMASQETGAAILKDSAARTLRWGPPRGAWTMDYREDRVNVRYDDAMKIIEITCG